MEADELVEFWKLLLESLELTQQTLCSADPPLTDVKAAYLEGCMDMVRMMCGLDHLGNEGADVDG